MITSKSLPSVSSLPTYIKRHGDLVGCAPIMLQDTLIRAFLLKADETKLQDLCDRVFNRPSGGALNFRPLSNSIFLSFAEIENIHSQHEEDAQAGSLCEIDVAFWIPLLSETNGKPHISWYIPYIFVDDPFAMATGRELYGFPKTIGQFQIPKEIISPLAYRVETMAIERFHARARVMPMEILEVVRKEETETRQPTNGLGALISTLMGENEPFTTRAALSWAFFQNLLDKRAVNMLFLRQLRDIKDPTRAAYQEVIEAPSKVVRLRRWGLIPGSFEVMFTPNATFPIAEELGLNPERHPVEGAFWADMDFTVGLGKTVWKPG